MAEAAPDGLDMSPLTPREQELWHALKSVGAVAAGLLGGEIVSGVTGADFGILSRLEELGEGSLGQAALARSLSWDKSRLSHQLTRMEERGLIKRARAEGSRGITVVLLPAGAQALARARPHHAAAVRRRFLNHLTDDDARALIGLAKALTDQSPPQ